MEVGIKTKFLNSGTRILLFSSFSRRSMLVCMELLDYGSRYKYSRIHACVRMRIPKEERYDRKYFRIRTDAGRGPSDKL
jgi:hypothetical protein